MVYAQFAVSLVLFVVVILMIRRRQELSRQLRGAREFRDLALRLIELDGAVPYIMRPGPTPEEDTYEHLGEGIEGLVGVPAAQVDHAAWVRLMQRVVPEELKYADDPGKYGEAFKVGRVQEYRVRLLVRLADGSEKWLSDRSLPLRHEVSGRLEGTLGALRECDPPPQP